MSAGKDHRPEARTEQERAESERAIRESERRFAGFMENLPGLAWIKDLEGRYVFANAYAEKAFGKTGAELYGKTDFEIFPAATALQFQSNDREAVTSGGVRVVEALAHEDGIVHYSLVSKFPIAGPDGAPAYVGGMAIDITDRLQADHALREANRKKDEFLATLAHELRNPLAPIRNALEIIRRSGTSSPLVDQAREMMERQVVHMVRLIDDLLDVSRITRGKLDIKRERVDLNAVVRNAVEMTRHLYEGAGQKLTVILPQDPVPVRGDAVRLTQVVYNLLNNASKFSGPGDPVWLGAVAEHGFVTLSVRDRGAGIPESMLTEIFEMFVQVDHTLVKSQGGLGIGLTLARQIVEMHDGSIEARSAGFGHGSELIVRLPLAPAPDASAETAADSPAPASISRRILVVDDNVDAAESLCVLLKLQGHDAMAVHDGFAALKAAESFKPRIVFLDIAMPVLSGYDVARVIRREPWGRGMTLIALTGWGQASDRELTRQAGFDDHLTKPVAPESLAGLLARLAEH
jgi:PAS domain S-box-containing protein